MFLSKKFSLLKVIPLLLVGLFLTSCSTTFHTPSKKYTWTTISQLDLSYFLVNSNGVHAQFGPELTSDPYCIPSVSWIKEVYAPYLWKFLYQNNIFIPTDPDNNCVRFSNYGVTAGYILHAIHNQGPEKTSLAIGTVDYVIDLFNWHSINGFVATDDNGKLVIIYFEPQTQKIIPSDQVETQWLGMRM